MNNSTPTKHNIFDNKQNYNKTNKKCETKYESFYNKTYRS